MWIPRLPEFLLMLVLAAPAAAAAAADESAQRERIARERGVVEREAQAAQAACALQFAVTACVDRAKAERRQRLQQLDAERAVLDDALRKRRAADRLARIQRREAVRGDERPTVTVRTRAPAASEAATPVSAPERSLPAASASAAKGAAASQADGQAALRAAAAARRTAEAAAHRSAVEARNRERAVQKTPAQPLPAAPAASRAGP